jgi:hypothetical protein
MRGINNDGLISEWVYPLPEVVRVEVGASEPLEINGVGIDLS